MAKPSKFFRVAVEGATTDGRNIERNWITQMAKNFDPTKYGARIWMEHLRGTLPDSPFRAYGDVLALKSEEVDIGGQKKMGLFAQIDPTPDLVNMTKDRQKIYTSIEINQKFADTGEAYLVGLGVTDSPASLGTEVLQFAAQNPAASPFAGRKQSPENLFSAATEVVIEFEEDDGSNLFTKTMKELLAKFTKRETTNDNRFAEVTEVLGEIVETVVEQSATYAAQTELADLRKKHDALQVEFTSLKSALDREPGNQPQRPAATGGGTEKQTDC